MALVLEAGRRYAAPADNSIFCWTLAVAEFGEAPLIGTALDAGVYQRGCDQWRIYSNVSRLANVSDHSSCDSCVEEAVTGPLDVPRGGYADTPLNTPVFQRVWRHIFNSRAYECCAWTIKFDADAVFMPQRLRMYLALFPAETPLYGNNAGCTPDRQFKIPGVGGYTACRSMHGGMEAVSRSAVELYAANANACEKADSSKIGEDWYLTLCLKSLNVSQADMQLLLRDDSGQKGALCEGCWVAYHNYKTPEDWTACYKSARTWRDVPHYTTDGKTCDREWERTSWHVPAILAAAIVLLFAMLGFMWWRYRIIRPPPPHKPQTVRGGETEHLVGSGYPRKPPTRKLTHSITHDLEDTAARQAITSHNKYDFLQSPRLS